MADNVLVGGVNYSTDDVTNLNGGTIAAGTAQTQRIKVQYGDDNAARDVSGAFPMPVIINDVTATGTLAAAAQTVAIALNGDSAASIQLTGTWVGTVTFEGTTDGTTWVPINGVSAASSTPATTATANGLYRLTPGGLAQLRANATAWTSGTATVTVRASEGTGGIFANQILPMRLTDATTAANQAKIDSAGSQYMRKAAAATGTITAVAASATSVVVLAANTGRMGGTVYNDSTALLYLALAATASNTLHTIQVAAGGYYELPNDGCGYVGAISGIWATATGSARVTELTI